MYGNGEICYRRTELPVVGGGYKFEQHVTISRCDSREIRGVILAMWVALDHHQRQDMITELVHYQNEVATVLPPMALENCVRQHGSRSRLCPSETSAPITKASES